MRTVRFTRMADGTKEDYDLLSQLEEKFIETLPDRLLQALDELRHSFSGYQVSRYEHSLQSASRAYHGGKSEEYFVMTIGNYQHLCYSVIFPPGAVLTTMVIMTILLSCSNEYVPGN